MHFGYERASGINHSQLAFLRFGANAGRHAMRAENEHCANWYFFDGLDENRAAAAQLVHYVPVVHDFVMDVNRIAVGFQREFHDIHRANYAGAEAARAHAHKRLGSVISAVDLGQRQFVLRKSPLFYLNRPFAATLFAFAVCCGNGKFTRSL
jgi:hypothetical protein